VIEVEDTGVGIPLEDQPRVFERFYRVDKARTRECGGTGLGLAIVKHLVENRGGTVSLSSAQDKGTTFTIQLPSAAQYFLG
jgi:two-component system phosphate regulon sensor histidine kinase PhoR